MKTPKWFARWRLRVWSVRVTLYRQQFNRADYAADVDWWKRELNWGMAKQAKWKRKVRA